MKSDQPKFTVDLKAGEMTEIFVIGDGYRLLDRGVGNLTVQLPHGRYLIKSRKGSETSQKAIRVSENQQFVLEEQYPMSGMSMRSASTTDSVVDTIFQEMMLNVGPTPGNGTALIVFEDRDSDLNRGRSLKLLDSQLKTLQTLQTLTPRNNRQAVLRLDLLPGHYYLSCDIESAGQVCLALEVFPGVQTQVHVLRQKTAGPRSRRREADLAAAQVSMISHDVAIGYDEFVDCWETTQTAAQALALQRPTPPESILNSHLYDKFKSPLLGLLGTHLLLASGKPDENLVSQVLANLKRLMPDSTDVTALEVIASHKFGRSSSISPGKLPRISVPPLLRASWNVFLESDHRRSEGAFAKNSVAARCHPIASSPTPWFLWTPQPQKTKRFSEPQIDAGTLERIRAAKKVPARGIAVQRLVKGLSETASISKNIGEIAQGLRVPRQQVPAYLLDLESDLSE